MIQRVRIDNFFQVPADHRGAIYRLTAILLATIEGLGCIVAIWALNTSDCEGK